jgi:hypothetical protein
MSNTKLTERIIETLQSYDRETLIRAYKEHFNGAGGNTVGAYHGGFLYVPTHGCYTVIGDRMIDAGRWICEQEGIDIQDRYTPGLVNNSDEYKCCTFHGSWGEIKVFIPTGEVVEVVHDGYANYTDTESFGGYHHIKRVNMEEFKDWLRTVPTPDGHGHHINYRFSWDILDVGFWTTYGTYEAADEDHRKLIISLIEEDNVSSI